MLRLRPSRLSLLVLLPAILLTACDPPSNEEKPAEMPSDISDSLGPDASRMDIALHMLAARRHARTTHALVDLYPEMDREDGYAIQRLALDVDLDEGAELVGWKMGGTRLSAAAPNLDPVFGYSTNRNLFSEEAPVPASVFVGGEPMVEAEIAVWMGKDLPGPDATREQALDAIESIGAGSEFVSPRLRPHGDRTPSLSHALADDASHAGAILSPHRVPVSDIDFDAETATIFINGEQRASGSAAVIMGEEGDPIDAVVALANELSRRGLMLRAGQFVLTGSLYDNPTMKAGDTAEIRYATLGTLRVALGPAGSGS